MLKISPMLSKTIVGLTASAILIPVMSNSASAASLKLINGVVGLAAQNNSSSQSGCSRLQSGWQITLTCNQSYTANTKLGISKAGSSNWKNIYQAFQFTGTPGKRYRINRSLTGNVSGSVKAAGGTGALASSALMPLNKSSVSSVNLAAMFMGSFSDWNSHYSAYQSFEFNGGQTWLFLVGALTRGISEAYGIGSASAKSSINFTSVARITEIGQSRSSFGFASAASTSDDESTIFSDEDSVNVSDEEFTSSLDADFIQFSDEQLAFFTGQDFISDYDNDVITSVPEPSQIVGLAALLAMLLATNGFRFAKKNPIETEKLIGTSTVKV
ncbi:MAG: hypothetical protein WBV73_19685 [Phormidium sp.]